MPQCNNCGNTSSFQRKAIVGEWDIFDEGDHRIKNKHSEHGETITLDCPHCDEELTIHSTPYECVECGSTDLYWQ